MVKKKHGYWAFFLNKNTRFLDDIAGPIALILTLLLIALYLNYEPFFLASKHPVKNNEPIEITYENDPFSSLFYEYVEANKSAPEEAPLEKTHRIAAISQISAQEDPDLAEIDNSFPKIEEGEMPDSQKIIEQAVLSEAQLPPVNPLQEEPPSPSSQMVEEETISEEEALLAQFNEEENTLSVAHTEPELPTPLPRPTLEEVMITAPLKMNNTGTNRLGATAANTQASPLGAYIERLLEAVNAQWRLLITQYNLSLQDINTYVLVSFRFDRWGYVSNITIEHANASPVAILLCKEAIQARAPFGAWNEEMVHALGKEFSLSIHFQYL